MKHNAFDIWNEHESMLRNYIRRRVTDPADAEDVLHTVLLKIHRYFESNSDVANLRAWLYQVCYHAVIDHYKQHSRFLELSDYDLPASHSEVPADKAAEWIEPLLAQLPEEYAGPLKMADIDGWKQQDIADRKSISLTAAKSRIQRARKKLKDKFDECGIIEKEGNEILFTVTKPCCKNLLQKG
ncbi:MAG: sigma-70 family RNA polymerase sigma factor [Balneolaceae bacterium]